MDLEAVAQEAWLGIGPAAAGLLRGERIGQIAVGQLGRASDPSGWPGAYCL